MLFPLVPFVAGLLLVVEAVASPFLSGERAYHGLNVPLNLALAAAVFLLARAIPGGRLARVGAWIAGVAAALAAAGGVVPLALGEAPGWLEGVTHGAVLLSFLGLALFAGGLLFPPRASRAPLWTLLVASALPVVLVLAGLDDPRIFLAPEALVGVGLAWTAWDVTRGAPR